MDMDSSKIKEFVLFNINRNVTNLYKRYINLTEDTLNEHKTLLGKVKSQVSPEFANNIDYFTDERYNHVRKKILDMGNEVIRDIEKTFEMLDVKINPEKVEEMIRLKSFKIEGGFGKNQKVKGKFL